MTYPYVNSASRLIEFLKKLKDIGVPQTFSLKNVKALGYTSSNDERFLQAIKFIGLLEDKKGGKPTELWSHDLKANFGEAMAKGIQQGYADLFSQYPDAYQRDDEALRTYFSVHSGLGADSVSKMAGTFKAMCGIAKFAESERNGGTTGDSAKEETGGGVRHDSVEEAGGASGDRTMTVNINVQLQVPPDATGEIYDKFFEAMRKHLWPQKK